MNKRGLSGVITVVLIILIVIIAISIVWVFVQPTIFKAFGDGGDSGEVDRFSTCLNLRLEAVSCIYNDTQVDVKVKRGTGKGDLEEIRFTFDVPGNQFTFSSGDSLNNPSLPDSLESQTFNFLNSGRNVNGVKVAGIFTNGEACGFSQEIDCREGLSGDGGDGGEEDRCDVGLQDGYCDYLLGENPNSCPADCEGIFLGNSCPVAGNSRIQGNTGPKALVDNPDFFFDDYPSVYNPGVYSADDVVIDGVDMKAIRFQFESIDVPGWSTSRVAYIYVPADSGDVNPDVLITNANTGTSDNSEVSIGMDDPVYGQNYPGWFLGTDNGGGTNYLENYKLTFASISARTKAPMVFYDVVPNSIIFDSTTRQLISDYENGVTETKCDDINICEGDTGVVGDYKITKDGNIRYCLNMASVLDSRFGYDSDGYLVFALAQKRLIDATQDVLNQYSQDTGWGVNFNFQDVFGMGSSKRGNTQRLFLAIDDRVKGTAPYASDFANLYDYWLSNKYVWDHVYWYGDEHGNPSGDTFDAYRGPTPYELISDVSVWRDWAQTFDHQYWDWGSLGNKRYAVGVGTRDWNYQFGSALAYWDSMPSGSRMMFIPNYPHGHGAVDHVIGYESMIKDYLEPGFDWPEVDATLDWTGELDVNVLDADSGLSKVEVWCATAQCGDVGCNPSNWVQDTRKTGFLDVENNIPDTNANGQCQSVNDFATAEDYDLRQARFDRAILCDGDCSGTSFNENINNLFTFNDGNLKHEGCFVRVESNDGGVSSSLPLLSRSLCERTVVW